MRHDKKAFLKKEYLGQLRFEKWCSEFLQFKFMYKMSSLLKVTVMKVNTFHVNGRFTVASGWHKNK